MGLLLALISYVGWGVGDIFGVFSTRKMGAYLTTVYLFLFGFVLTSLYIPFALDDFYKISFGLLLINILLGALCLFGNFLCYEAYKSSNVSLVGIIVQAFPAVVLVLSALIFKDPITERQIVWILVIFIGLLLCTINFSDFKKGKVTTDKGIKYALIAAGIFSIYFTFLRTFIDAYGWFWANYIAFASFPIALILIKYLFNVKEKISLPAKNVILVAAFLSAFLIRAGDIALNYGIAKGFSSIVAPIAGASPTLFITLASIIYRDVLLKQQKIGIGISLVGIVLLSFFST